MFNALRSDELLVGVGRMIRMAADATDPLEGFERSQLLSAFSVTRLLASEQRGAAGATIREAFGRGDLAAMVAAVPDAMVDALAVAGTPADVRAQLRRYEGVLDHAILYTPSFGLAPERVRRCALDLVAAVAPA